MEQNERKLNRLENYDYSSNGLYFITICTKDREKYLSDIISVGDGVLDVPELKLKEYGRILNDQIIEINSIYEKLKIIKYVIMPDHLHMIIYLFDDKKYFWWDVEDAVPYKCGHSVIDISVEKICK